MRVPGEGGVKNDFKVSNLGNWINVMFFCEMRDRECESVTDTKINGKSL